jgi:hypothetical protein
MDDCAVEGALISVWNAIELIGHARKCLGMAEIRDALTATEAALFTVIRKLARNAQQSFVSDPIEHIPIVVEKVSGA